MKVMQHDRPLILCIEDEPDLREDIAEEIEEAGFRVAQAGDGQQALRLLDEVCPDLILCDITMPGMSGYELLKVLRKTRPDLHDVPFVFLTAQTDPKQIVEGKLAGADDYLIKPIDFELMLATIQARITQVARIRQYYSLEVRAMQDALRDLHTQRNRDVFEHITRAFDYVSFGIVLLDADSKVRFANRASRSMASAVTGMSLDRKFMLECSREMAALRAAFDVAIRANETRTDVVECLTITGSDQQRSLLFMVCALGNQQAVQTDGPVVMVIMSDPAHRQPVAPGALESLFGLTRTEAQVANAFAEGKRTEQIATQFGISSTTVNFHKRNLFEKTGTNRQADMIALLLSVPVSGPASGAA